MRAHIHRNDNRRRIYQLSLAESRHQLGGNAAIPENLVGVLNYLCRWAKRRIESEHKNYNLLAKNAPERSRMSGGRKRKVHYWSPWMSSEVEVRHLGNNL